LSTAVFYSRRSDVKDKEWWLLAGIWDEGAEVPGRGVGGVKGKADLTMTSIQRLKSAALPRKKPLPLSTQFCQR
jgi:hypothetical protein